MPEREITRPVDLCLPDGRLDPEAVGWTRTPLHRANLRRGPGWWGRTKRWEYWGVVTPTHVLGLVVSSLDYAGVLGIYLLDRASGQETTYDEVVPLGRGVVLPDRAGRGPVSASGPRTAYSFDQGATATRLQASGPDVAIDLEVAVVPGQESLGVVVPWSRRQFQYTVKDLARPVTGTITAHGTSYDVGGAAGDAWAVLDHGRGRWPYSMTWNWAAGSGPGRAIQLGGRWTAGTPLTENALLVDGRLHKIGEELRWTYDRSDWLRPWEIRGERVEARFHPFHERVARTSLVVLAGETHQCFGHFTGWACTDDGERVDLDGLVGWAEEARNRW